MDLSANISPDRNRGKLKILRRRAKTEQRRNCYVWCENTILDNNGRTFSRVCGNYLLSVRIKLYLYSYVKIPLTCNLNCIQTSMTGNTIFLYFSLNFKEKNYIHVKEAITEIFAQQIINSINFAFMPTYEVVRKITDYFIHTYSVQQLNETKP